MGKSLPFVLLNFRHNWFFTRHYDKAAKQPLKRQIFVSKGAVKAKAGTFFFWIFRKISSKCHNQTCKCTLDGMLSRRQAQRTSSTIISSFAASLCCFFDELINLDRGSSKFSDDDEPDNTHHMLTRNQVNGDNLNRVWVCAHTRVVPLFDRLVPLLLLVPADYLRIPKQWESNCVIRAPAYTPWPLTISHHAS